MNKVLGEEYEGLKKAQFLQDNCDRTEDVGYMRRFTPEEITGMKDELSEVAIQIIDNVLTQIEAILPEIATIEK